MLLMRASHSQADANAWGGVGGKDVRTNLASYRCHWGQGLGRDRLLTGQVCLLVLNKQKGKGKVLVAALSSVATAKRDKEA